MLVADGVHWLKVEIPVGPRHGNLYLLEDPDGPVLVDAGFPSDEFLAEFTARLDRIGYAPGDIAMVVVTHEHMDHTGLSVRLRESYGTQIWAHEAAFRRTSRFGNNRDYWSPAGRQWWLRMGLPTDEFAMLEQNWVSGAARVEPFEPDRRLTDGEVLAIGGRDYQVLWTPGHAEAHICLYDAARRLLLSGDHVLPRITPHIGRDHVSPPNPLQDYRNSLDKVSQFEVDLVLPGHYPPFRDGTSRMAEIKRHHDDRSLAMEEALGRERRSAFEVTRAVFGDNSSFIDRQMAYSETVAHMYYLAANGRVVIEQGDPVTLYSLVDNAHKI